MKNIIAFLFLFSSLFASSQTQYIGAPNTTVVARGNMKVDSILYLPKREKTPTDTGALRYQISDSSLYVWTGNAWRKAKNDGTVTSVGLTMPSAFSVANSPVTSSGTLAVTATGTVAEYIRGDGSLGTLPSSGGGGGSGVNYYLNGSVSQGTIGGSTYYEMNKTPIIGAGTDFSRGTDGIVAQFITDSLDPNRLLIPAGAWNFELYFSASSAGGTPSFYIELFEYDGTNFTSIASSVSNPISITNGTAVSLYVASLAVPETVLTATDRLAVRISVNVSGRTITLHTEDNNLAQVITTFSGGLVSLNGLTANDQFFTTGTSGSDFNISSTSATHTFNLPTASSTVRGALSSSDWTTFNNKVNISDTAAMLTNYIRHAGNGLTKTGQALSVDTLNISTKAWRQKGIDSVASVRVGGTGTTNYVPKWSGTSTQTISTIFDNGTNVGIGTTSPSRRFSISTPTFTSSTSPTYASDDQASISWNYFSSSNFFRSLDLIAGGAPDGTNGSSNIRFFTNAVTSGASATEKMRITPTGDVAIGNTSPSYKLDVSGTLRNTTGAAFATSSGNVLIGTTTDGGSYKLDVQGALRNTTGAVLASTSGSVSIGTTATDRRLTIKVTPGTTTDDGVYLFDSSRVSVFSRTGSAYVYKGVPASSGFIYSNTNFSVLSDGGYHSWHTTSNERMRLTSGGNLMLNTTSDVGYRADINGSFRNTTDAYFATTSGNVGIATTSPSEKLDVAGKTRIRTIDSTATGMNMLYADATGVIKKAAVPSGGITGTGISGYFPKWTGTATQDTSQLFQLGQNIGIGTATPTYRIHLPDAGNTSNQAMLAGTIFGSDGNGQTIKPSGSVAMALFGQNDIGYIYGAAVSSTGRWGINTRSLNDATFNVDGSVKIVTIDSTSTARNMLYQDANGVIKKSVGLSMADDVMTASGSWVATKDAGSGVTINNVAYTTNGTTKMVTIDGNFYTDDFTQEAWVDIATIVTAYRPKKSVYFPASLRYEGADFERADNTDFTGSVVLVYGQLRVTDDGKIQVYASISSNNIAAGGTSYFLIPFQVSYIIK